MNEGGSLPISTDLLDSHDLKEVSYCILANKLLVTEFQNSVDLLSQTASEKEKERKLKRKREHGNKNELELTRSSYICKLCGCFGEAVRMRRGKKENSRRRRSWFSRGLFLWSESSHSACARATLYSVDQRDIPCHPFFWTLGIVSAWLLLNRIRKCFC